MWWCGDGDANMEVNDTPDVNGVVINTVADFHLDVKHQKSGSRHYRNIVTLGNLKISIGKRGSHFELFGKQTKSKIFKCQILCRRISLGGWSAESIWGHILFFRAAATILGSTLQKIWYWAFGNTWIIIWSELWGCKKERDRSPKDMRSIVIWTFEMNTQMTDPQGPASSIPLGAT